MDDKHGKDIFTWDKVTLALEAGKEGLYIWNIKEKIIHYTNQCLDMMGCSTKENAPNIFTESERIIHEEDRVFFDNEVRRYLNGYFITPMNLEVRMLKQHSLEWQWVRVTGLLERDEHRNPVSLVGVFVNITGRKTSELRAVEERELFRALIDHIPNNIYVKNRESRFIMANTATAKKMGVPTPSDLIGRTDASFFDTAMSSISRREEKDIMTTRKPIIGAIHHETWLNGQESWVMVSKFPWLSANGDLKGVVGITSDVTKLVKAEMEVRKSAKLLKQRNEALEKEVNLAREIQLALLPYSLPSQTRREGNRMKEANFHHIFAPAEGVAGDWFGVQLSGDYGVGAIVCDVMGHGIRAALIASMLRGLIEQSSDQSKRPHEILASLNKQLSRILTHANVTMFASAVYIYFDLKKNKLTVCSAGHPAPIIVTPGGKAEKLTLPRGIAMGLVQDAVYSSAEFILEPGTQVLLYTDGLTEATNKEGDELGDERVRRYFEKHPQDNVKDFVLGALKCAAKFCGYNQLSDDICLVGMQFDEKEAETSAEEELLDS